MAPPPPPPPIVLCGRKATFKFRLEQQHESSQELCESGGGRPGFLPSQIVLMVSVDVKQQ